MIRVTQSVVNIAQYQGLGYNNTQTAPSVEYPGADLYNVLDDDTLEIYVGQELLATWRAQAWSRVEVVK